MQSIYVENSVVSFLRENASASPESVERQRITRRWCELHRHRYELVTSQYVVDEASMGNSARAQERAYIWPVSRWSRSAAKSTNSPPKSWRGRFCRRMRSSMPFTLLPPQ
jgi:hypothetical protein